MKTNNNEIQQLHKKARAADEHFSSELRRVYGPRAGDARYQWRHDDEQVTRAMHAKLAADKTLWAAKCNAGFATNY